MDDSKIIDDLGGTAKVAAICEVSPQAVSQWRKNDIPKQQLRYLKLAFPEAFGLPPAKKVRRAQPAPG